MTPEQEIHLDAIKSDFVAEVDAKYRAGQAEHGGNLFDMNDLKLVNEALKEAVDMYVYLFTLREKIRESISLYKK